MTALLPVRGRLLLCRTTGPTSLQHSMVATLIQQQLRISQLYSQPQPPRRPQILHQLTQLRPILRPLHLLRPLQHQLHPLQRRPHLRLRPQQILLQLPLRLRRPRLQILRLPTQLQLHLPQLSQL